MTDDVLARADRWLNNGHQWTAPDTLVAELAETLRAANERETELIKLLNEARDYMPLFLIQDLEKLRVLRAEQAGDPSPVDHASGSDG